MELEWYELFGESLIVVARDNVDANCSMLVEGLKSVNSTDSIGRGSREKGFEEAVLFIAESGWREG